MSGITGKSVDMTYEIKFRCKYPSCLNFSSRNSTKNEIRFFNFPRNPVRLLSWKKACLINPSKNCSNFHVCENHFLPCDYNNPSNPVRLKFNSVPRPAIEFQIHHDHPYNSRTSLNISSCIENVDDSNNNHLHDFELLYQIHHDHSYISRTSLNDSFLIENSSRTSLNNSSLIENIKDSNINNLCDPDYQEISASLPDILMSNITESPSCSKTGINGNSSLDENESGYLLKSNLPKSGISADQAAMYKIHRNVSSKLSKLKSSLRNTRSQLNALRNMYDDGRFELIENNLNEVTANFINAQLRNINKSPTHRRWTIKDKAFSLSIFKRSPKLYKYLRSFFQLPSPRVLKTVLASIPFHCGLLKPVLEHLKLEIQEMDNIDRYCALIFDEISLSAGFFYEPCHQRISGFQDLGTLGRTSAPANHALVFMIRGIRKSYKMPIAYYFTKDSVKTDNLKELIIQIIRELQLVGIKVCATICDQGSTNRTAIAALTREFPGDTPNNHQFVINKEPIVTIFDIPHFLKCTRNALISSKIEFETGKFATMDHIEQAFHADNSKRTYKCLNKIKESYFNFKDNYLKMKVKVAAQQLSHSVAAAIETFQASGELEYESLDTAEFCHLMDNLFDSFNSSQLGNNDGKLYRTALSDNSPHLKLWSDLLPKIRNWKIFDKNAKLKNNYKFVEGWQISIQAAMLLWQHLKLEGLKFLNMRNLNQDPLENFFGQIRQHGICNTNPTCIQFVAALKSLMMNNLSSPVGKSSNCEEDYCRSLGNFGNFLEKHVNRKNQNSEESIEGTSSAVFNDIEEIYSEINNLATPYVAGYILKKLKLPECINCYQGVYSEKVENWHLFVSFKEFEHNENTRLNYASKKFVQLLDLVHNKLYKFLETNEHKIGLEDIFMNEFKEHLQKFIFCYEHKDVSEQILKLTLRLLLYKYTKDRNSSKTLSSGHFRKQKIFSESKPPKKMKMNCSSTTYS